MDKILDTRKNVCLGMRKKLGYKKADTTNT